MAYGPSLTDARYRPGLFAGKILKGSGPGNIPIEGPAKFDFVINLRTAKVLGLMIPLLLPLADQVSDLPPFILSGQGCKVAGRGLSRLNLVVGDHPLGGAEGLAELVLAEAARPSPMRCNGSPDVAVADRSR